MKRIITWARKKGHSVAQLKDTPVSIARGVAVGTFYGFVPLLGLKTLLSIGSAKLLRGNVVAAVVAVTLHDIILPLAPLIMAWEYQLGHWLLGGHADGAAASQGFHVRELLHWSTFQHFIAPALLGSVIIGLPFALAAFWLARSAMIRIRLRQAAEALAAAEEEGGAAL